MEDLNLSRSGEEHADPALGEIEDAVCAVAAGEDFVILERAEKHWIQYDGRVLEYREGERVFRADLAEPVAATFRAYAEGGEAWKDAWHWQDVTDDVLGEGAAGHGRRWLLVLIVAGLLGVAAAGLLAALGVL